MIQTINKRYKSVLMIIAKLDFQQYERSAVNKCSLLYNTEINATNINSK